MVELIVICVSNLNFVRFKVLEVIVEIIVLLWLIEDFLVEVFVLIEEDDWEIMFNEFELVLSFVWKNVKFLR